MTSSLPQSPRRAGSLAANLYEIVRADILFARLQPGERMRSDALRLRYGASVGTIREALNRLRAEGLVQQEDQRGFRVAPVGLAELRELTATRCSVNSIAIPESLRHGGQAWEEAIVLAFHRLTRVKLGPEREDRQAGMERHRAFHASLYAACGSRFLLAFANDLFDRAVQYQSLAITVAPQPRNIINEHRAIMDAVLARDAATAVALLERHLWETTERLERSSIFDAGDTR